jgi:hypothetical protein
VDRASIPAAADGFEAHLRAPWLIQIVLGLAKVITWSYYLVAADDGIAAGEPTECFNPVAVVMPAEALLRKEGYVGAVAFSRRGDPATGNFSDAKVIRKFGDVPDDLSAL